MVELAGELPAGIGNAMRAVRAGQGIDNTESAAKLLSIVVAVILLITVNVYVFLASEEGIRAQQPTRQRMVVVSNISHTSIHRTSNQS